MPKLRPIRVLVATALGGMLCWGAPSPATFLAQADQHWGMLKTYCVACHNAKLRTGGLAFDELDAGGVPGKAQVWEKVVRKLRGGMMPPPGMPRPDKRQADAFVSWMEGYLDASAALDPNPGEVALHRLNRKEYANAIYDILGLKVDASELLPQDAQANGFDNIANVLQASPAFFNQYMAAARTVAVQAVGRPDARPGSKTYVNPGKGAQAFHVDGLPLGTRGGFAVQHAFPSDGEYEINLPSPLRNISWATQRTCSLTSWALRVTPVTSGPPGSRGWSALRPRGGS